MLTMSNSVGDQHKPNGTTTSNPFEEAKPRMSEYTAQEIATLQSRLDKQLGPEFISSRPGAAGQKVHYLAAEKVINLANEVFGFNGWSSSIQNIQIDFVDINEPAGKVSLGLSVTVRVTLKDGAYHEDIGYGHIENCKGKAAAFEKAKKEGTTDALKRALRTFGNVLGNCVYDKEYVSKVTKVKVGAGRWDPDALHRHPDYVIKKEQEPKPQAITAGSNSTAYSELESINFDDFDDAEFDENDTGNPDEVVLPMEPIGGQNRSSIGPPQAARSAVPNHMTTPSRPPNARTATAPPAAVARPSQPAAQAQNAPQRPLAANNMANPAQNNRPLPGAPVVHAETQQNQVHNAQNSSSPGVPSQHFAPPPRPQQALPGSGPQTVNAAQRPAGFYSARAAASIDAENNIVAAVPAAVPLFNPHAESPSIRKTAGVNHNATLPINRHTLKADPKPDPNQAQDQKKEFVDPRADQARRVGVPGQSVPSPRPQGSAFRPLTRRPPEAGVQSNAATGANAGDVPNGVDRVLVAAKRPPLGDVSNMQHTVTASTGDGADAKRQRVGPGMAGATTTGPENAAAAG